MLQILEHSLNNIKKNIIELGNDENDKSMIENLRYNLVKFGRACCRCLNENEDDDDRSDESNSIASYDSIEARKRGYNSRYENYKKRRVQYEYGYVGGTVRRTSFVRRNY